MKTEMSEQELTDQLFWAFKSGSSSGPYVNDTIVVADVPYTLVTDAEGCVVQVLKDVEDEGGPEPDYSAPGQHYYAESPTGGTSVVSWPGDSRYAYSPLSTAEQITLYKQLTGVDVEIVDKPDIFDPDYTFSDL